MGLCSSLLLLSLLLTREARCFSPGKQSRGRQTVEWVVSLDPVLQAKQILVLDIEPKLVSSQELELKLEADQS